MGFGASSQRNLKKGVDKPGSPWYNDYSKTKEVIHMMTIKYFRFRKSLFTGEWYPMEQVWETNWENFSRRWPSLREEGWKILSVVWGY